MVGDTISHSDISFGRPTKLGFQVLDGLDLDKPSFDRKVRDFAASLQGAQVGVFFFAGHGPQVAGHNYLVPIDAQPSTASALDFEMVRLDLVHRTMEREAQTNILFLDACRDNPLARNLARAMGTRSTEIGRGLADVESGVGTLISFSTQPGNVALDGSGRNSPFAGSLVKHVSSSSDDLSAMLIAVRNDVMKETQRKQVPWEHSALTGRFYFNASASTPTQGSEAERAWVVGKDATSVPALEAFIRRFGDTYYGDLAKMRLAELKQAEAAKQAADAAKKADDDARAKAEAERQRLALLQQEEAGGGRGGEKACGSGQGVGREARGSRQRAAQDTATKPYAGKANEPAKVATLPKVEKPAGSGQFDGTWTIITSYTTKCGRHAPYTITISGGIVSGYTSSGSVSPSGAAVWTVDRYSRTHHSGTLRGNSGSGKWENTHCAGTFTAKRH